MPKVLLLCVLIIFKTRARSAGIFVMTVFTGVLVWALIIQHEYTHKNPGKLDWTSPGFGRGFGLAIMLGTAGNLVQNYLVIISVIYLHQMAQAYLSIYRTVLVPWIFGRWNRPTDSLCWTSPGCRSLGTVCFIWHQLIVRILALWACRN